MSKNKWLNKLWIFIIVISNISCDQISKIIVRDQVEYNADIPIVKNFITLTKVENTGAFLSLGSEMPRIFYQFIMIILPLVVIFYALLFLWKNKIDSHLLTLAIALWVGGGIGNIIDRIRFGSVTDFLHFNFGLFQTGIVNLADISITLGFFIFLFDIYVRNRSRTKVNPG